MATLRAPAPKSTLSAQRATVAPWGLAAPSSGRGGRVTATARREVPSARPGATRTAVQATASQPTASQATASVVRAAEARTATERRLIAVLLMVVVGAVAAVGATAANSTMSAGRSRERMGGTLGRASLVQMEFRDRNKRFAVWEELSRNGVRLAPELTVVTSNASSSHWYLRLRDRTTGVTCDRVGQLLDPPTSSIVPSCENAR